MALSPDEVTLLDMAICAGAFHNFSGQPANAMARVTPDIMANVRNKSEEEVRTVLRFYQVTAAKGLQDQITNNIIQLENIKANLTLVNSIVIAPAPAPTES